MELSPGIVTTGKWKGLKKKTNTSQKRTKTNRKMPCLDHLRHLLDCMQNFIEASRVVIRVIRRRFSSEGENPRNQQV